jgi:hypothetical protein
MWFAVRDRSRTDPRAWPFLRGSAQVWIAAGFAIGSLCFLVAPFPGFLQLVGARADAWVFFVGSLFFTFAAGLELLRGWAESDPHDENWWAGVIQFAGTLLFNLSTGDALRSDLDQDRLVWAPDAFGSACFLISGLLAYRGATTDSRRMAGVNLAGCVLFGIAAIASYVVPDTGSMLDLAAANWATAAGAACFFAGSLMLLRHRPQATEV